MTDRILATHVGSLPRPPQLLEYVSAITKHVAVDEKVFDKLLRDSVADVVKLQAKSGVDIVSDGEFGKFRTWSAYIIETPGRHRGAQHGARDRRGRRPQEIPGIL